MTELYDRIKDKGLTVRCVNIVAVNLIKENDIPAEAPEQLNLFTDYDAIEKQKAAESAADEKEKRIQKATLAIQGRYGKNALLKGMNLQKGATTIMRNGQIGGHAAEQTATRSAAASYVSSAPSDFSAPSAGKSNTKEPFTETDAEDGGGI